MSRTICFVRFSIILLLFHFSGFGQGLFENAGASDSSANEKNPIPSNFEIGGFIKAGLYGGQAENNDAEMKSEEGQISLKIGAKKEEIGKAFADIRLESGILNNNEVSKLDIREAWVQTTLGAVDFKAGQQIIVWGRADGVNPTNNITPCNPLAFSSETDDQRLGNILLQSSANWKTFRLEGVWVPVYKPDALPLESVTLPPGIEINSPNYPSNAVKNSSYAFRLNLEYPQIDGSVSYYDGYATLPGFAHDLTQTGVLLTPSAYRIHAIGCDFASTVGSYGIRGEAAFKKTYDDHKQFNYLPNPNLKYVLGIDKSVGDFSLLVQYAGEYIVDFTELNLPVLTDPSNLQALGIYKQQMADYNITRMNRLFLQQGDKTSHSLTARVGRTLLHETLKLEIAGIYNFTTKEYVARPSMSYDFTDALVLCIGGQYLDGPNESLYKLENKSLSYMFAELKLSF
jgi:hypothetical protein